MKLLALSAALALSAPLSPAYGGHGVSPQGSPVMIEFRDGSLVHARTRYLQVAFSPLAAQRCLPVKWSFIQELKSGPEDGTILVSFTNGDRLTARWTASFLEVESSFGSLKVPTAQITAIRSGGNCAAPTNIALGKPVSGQDGASHGKGLAKHVTDGDYETHAKPPAFHFDYTIDLREPETAGFSVSGIRIHWGRYGDRFAGVPAANGKGWASAAWPGEYVTSYQIEYRTTASDEWSLLHQCSGRPVDEDVENVVVEWLPSELAGCTSEVITTIKGLDLSEVAELRIRAKGGGHWIGLYELEVFGGAFFAVAEALRGVTGRVDEADFQPATNGTTTNPRALPWAGMKKPFRLHARPRRTSQASRSATSRGCRPLP